MTDEAKPSRTAGQVENLLYGAYAKEGIYGWRPLVKRARELDAERDAAEARAKLWQDAVAAVRAEADTLTKAHEAAEAQRDRLATALEERAFIAHLQGDERVHDRTPWRECGETGCQRARAALADVPDAARRRDEAYRAMVEVLTRLRQWDALNIPYDDNWPWGDWSPRWCADVDRALALARQVEG